VSAPGSDAPTLEGVVLSGEVLRAGEPTEVARPEHAYNAAAAEREAVLRFMREFKEMYVAIGAASSPARWVNRDSHALRSLEWLTNAIAAGVHRQDDWREVARTLAAAMMGR